MNLFRLDGQIALVTGSSQGLGQAMARGLAEAGAHVVLNGRDADKLEAAVAAFRADGFDAHGYAFDITDADQVQAQIADLQSTLGPVEILVNNAGIQRRAPIEKFALDDWRAVIDTNLNGAFIVTQPVVRGMIARRRGKIITICSLMSEVGRPTIVPYSTSKGGLKMFTKALAVELGRHNIQVNGIGPGYFVTEMNRPLIEDADFNAWVCTRAPAGRWGQPEELIGVTVFLASRASDYVNGQIIYVDGGMLAAV